ncbi:MAG TPA: peptidoglycan-binding domain-containing protein [Chthoniobacterales bacterium]|nr:peptidoglycan-binding domain-containing protein [Chthoniobacterales bacterium]
MSKKSALLFLMLAAFLSVSVCADEQTRQVQEELRKRHLFFRDIDGRPSPEYSIALRRYQERQGFPATGAADEMTLYSLGIGEPLPPAEGAAELPDLAVLKSDAALRELKPLPPEPIKPANAAGATKAEIRNFIRRYLEASQSQNPQDELAFYADRVDYFDHGVVDKTYIRNELAVYNQRWPSRKYSIGDSLRVVKGGNNTQAKVRVSFEVANAPHARTARGKTNNTFGLIKSGDSLQLVSVKEARVRRPSRHRRRPPSFPAAVGRTVHKVFRNIFR